MRNIAVICSDQAKYEESGELRPKVPDLHKKPMELEHQDTLTSTINLVRTYSNETTHEEADKLQIEMFNSGKPANSRN